MKFQGEHGFDVVNALAATGARVEVEDAVFVSLGFEHVRMSIDQQIRSFLGQQLTHGRAEDVGDPDGNTLTLQVEVLGVALAHLGAVDVAVDSAQGGPGGQAVGNLEVAKISGVPDLVAVAERVMPARIKVAVGVGEQADLQVARSLRRSATPRSRLRR